MIRRDYDFSDDFKEEYDEQKDIKPLISKILTAFIILFFALGLFFLIKLVPDLLDSHKSDDVFDTISEKSVSEYKNSDIKDAKVIDWNSLSSTEVVAWFSMDDISYPIMQHSDNRYYLTHLPDKSYNVGGSLFLLSENNPLFTDMSSFIYGHNMSSGRMFGKLKNYAKPEYKGKEFYLYFPDGTRRTYKFFAVKQVNQTSKAYTWSFSSEESFLEWQRWLLSDNIFDTGEKPVSDARFVTLSTCDGYEGTRSRLVICGREIRTEKISEKAFWYDDFLAKNKEKESKWSEKSSTVYEDLISFQKDMRNSMWKIINGEK